MRQPHGSTRAVQRSIIRLRGSRVLSACAVIGGALSPAMRSSESRTSIGVAAALGRAGRHYGCSPGCLIASLLLSLFLTLVINLLIRAF
jgi:hypothetical protein